MLSFSSKWRKRFWFFCLFVYLFVCFLLLFFVLFFVYLFFQNTKRREADGDNDDKEKDRLLGSKVYPNAVFALAYFQPVTRSTFFS